MKKIISLFILLFTINSNATFAQETKRRKKLEGNTLEDYYVLKGDKTTKHGQYIKFKLDILDNKNPIEMGHYDFGKKTGEWFFLIKQDH